MENNQNNIGYFPQSCVSEGTFFAEVNSEYSLPDYKSEIRRLLSSSASLVPKSDFLGNAEACSEGEIIYKLVYIGSDGGLYCATLTDKYRVDIPIKLDSHSLNADDLTLFADCNCDSMSVRVLGPRKVSVRSKIVCRALSLSPALYSPTITGDKNGRAIEKKIESVPSISARKYESEPIILNEVVPLDAQAEDFRLICSHSSVAIGECTHTEDAVNVRGDVIVKLLYCNDTESDKALTMTKKLPFNTSIAGGGHMDCSAYGIITDENITVGDNGIEMEIELLLHALTQENVPISYIADAYSTEQKTECTYTEIPVMQALKCFNSSLTQNNIVPLSEQKIDQNATIVDCTANAKISELTMENGKLALLGECVYHLIFADGAEYHSREITLPFKYDLDMRDTPKDNTLAHWNAHTSVSNSRAKSDGERIFLDCELGFCFFIQSMQSVQVLDTLALGDALEKDDGVLTFCYPDAHADLWDVAKRYGEPVDKLKTQNGLSSEDISGKRFIII